MFVFLACFGSFQVILGQFGAYFEPFWLVLVGFFSFWVNFGLLLCLFLLNLGFFGSFLLILCSLWLFESVFVSFLVLLARFRSF